MTEINDDKTAPMSEDHQDGTKQSATEPHYIRLAPDFKQLKSDIVGREPELANEILWLTGSTNPGEPERCQACPRCNAENSIHFRREDAKFTCECGYSKELVQLVCDVKVVDHTDAYDIIRAADANLCIDAVPGDPDISTADTPAVPEVPEPAPAPEANHSNDTTPDQDDETEGVPCTHLAPEEEQMISVGKIELTDAYRFRVEDDENVIKQYKHTFLKYSRKRAAGELTRYPFPPIIVLCMDGKYLVVAGRHRFQAAQRAGMTEILCIVLFDPTQAIQAGLKSNRHHGLRLNDGDKRHCIKIAVAESHTQSLGWSCRKIAGMIGCSFRYVAKVIEKDGLRTPEDIVVGQDGSAQPARKKRDKQSVKTQEDKANAPSALAQPVAEPDTEPTGNTEPVADKVGLVDDAQAISREEAHKAPIPTDGISEELKGELAVLIDSNRRADALTNVLTAIAANYDDIKQGHDFLKDLLTEIATHRVRAH